MEFKGFLITGFPPIYMIVMKLRDSGWRRHY